MPINGITQLGVTNSYGATNAPMPVSAQLERALSSTSALFASNYPGMTRSGTGADLYQYGIELQNAPREQAQAIGTAVNLESQLLSPLQEYQRQSLYGQAQSNIGLMNQLYDQTRGLQQQRFGSEIQMLGLGSQYATQAYRQSLPGYAHGVESIMGMQAMQGLMMGSELSAEDARYAQQSSRAAAAARGLTGNQAVAMEVLGGYNLRQQRSAERQQYAQMAYQMGTNAQMQGYNQFLSPAYQQSAMYSVPGILASAEQGVQNLGPQFLSPESQYLADIRNARLQKESAIEAAKIGGSAAKKSGMYSAGGSIIGASIIALCWVAREVYGSDNPKWLVFRDYVLNEAPDWFRNLYLKHGEKFAEYISDKPFIKFIIRKSMDFVVDRKLKEADVFANG